MIKKLLYSTLSGVFLAGLAFTAQAQTQNPVITFDQSSGVAATGSLSYDGNGGPATGSSITFDILTGRNTPQNSGPNQNLSCSSRCQLNFTTGGNTSEGPNIWTFDGGGAFTLTGTVKNQSGDTLASGQILDGSFDDTPTVSSSNNGGRLNLTAFGDDTQAQGVSDYFGITGDTTTFKFSSTNIVAQGATVGDDGSFSGDVNNADITNSLKPQQVPEPGVLSMFGLALLMVGGIVTLRRKNLQF